MKDLLRLLAAWALVHESADEGWKAAVARGQEFDATDALREGEQRLGPEAFVDALAALVSEEKELLKRELAAPREAGSREAGARAVGGRDREPDAERVLEALRFELAELRGAVESLQASVDALAARHEG